MPMTVPPDDPASPVVCSSCDWQGRADQAVQALDGLLCCPRCYHPVEPGSEPEGEGATL